MTGITRACSRADELKRLERLLTEQSTETTYTIALFDHSLIATVVDGDDIDAASNAVLNDRKLSAIGPDGELFYYSAEDCRIISGVSLGDEVPVGAQVVYKSSGKFGWLVDENGKLFPYAWKNLPLIY